MTHSKAIAPRVKEILENNLDARNSYNMLFVCILADYGVHLDSDQRKTVLQMPSVTSIDRAARKLWQENAAPRPSESVQEKRRILEREYREEMRGSWDFSNGKARWVQQ